MATNIEALTQVVYLVADAAVDTKAAIKPGQSLIQRVLNYGNLVKDVIAIGPLIGEVPAEAKDLDPADYLALTGALVTRLGITDAHAQAIVAASLKVLSNVIAVTTPDVKALLDAIHAPVVAVAPPVAAPVEAAPAAPAEPSAAPQPPAAG